MIYLKKKGKIIMNKKGFTLVELLATITIIAMILVLVMTISGSIQNNAKIGVYNEKIKSLEIQAALWGQEHSGLVIQTVDCPEPENFDYNYTYTCYIGLTVDTLVKEKYIGADNDEGDIFDPRDKNNTLNDLEFIVYHYYNNYYAKVIEI